MRLHGFHAHIYFDADEVDQARELAEAARAEFGCPVGRFHTRPVGPHPRGSCQLTLDNAQFERFATWAPAARGSLTIFAHGVCGNQWTEHTQLAVWFGDSETLDLTQFENERPGHTGHQLG